ncbi:protease pro-enzyme activation domain-containing protein [Streptomyces decoyicus]|uniref:protease pro-enzyme activation domain-containing protein n=1 Tax=Streptomyces decoyicus TaxID=249567 RepID=UPI001FD7F9AC|nr:protease pro-enzyme activation domain-containing protein [Streptomyces decoyicus]
MLRRLAEVPHELIVGPETISQSELAQQYGADPADADLVREVLGRFGLQVTDVDLAARRVTVAGTVAQMAEAFRTELTRAASPDPVSGEAVEHRHREGPLEVPAPLDGVVVAVLGLDDPPAGPSPPAARPRGGAPDLLQAHGARERVPLPARYRRQRPGAGGDRTRRRLQAGRAEDLLPVPGAADAAGDRGERRDRP